MDRTFCQSCGMPLTDDNKGTNADGFPRPVPMDKGHTKGCNEVWVATGADSVKTADFRMNPKAGLCYSFYGDSAHVQF